MPQLSQMKCIGCHGGEPPLSRKEVDDFLNAVPGWQVEERDGTPRLERKFTFPDFATALAFTDRVGQIAEEQGHHPRILTEWGRVTVTWWTHATGGLHLNDFVMAAKTSDLFET